MCLYLCLVSLDRDVIASSGGSLPSYSTHTGPLVSAHYVISMVTASCKLASCQHGFDLSKACRWTTAARWMELYPPKKERSQSSLKHSIAHLVQMQVSHAHPRPTPLASPPCQPLGAKPGQRLLLLEDRVVVLPTRCLRYIRTSARRRICRSRFSFFLSKMPWLSHPIHTVHSNYYKISTSAIAVPLVLISQHHGSCPERGTALDGSTLYHDG